MSIESALPDLLFFEEWRLDAADVADVWDNKVGIVIGSDVWIGFEAVILGGGTVGDGAVIVARLQPKMFRCTQSSAVSLRSRSGSGFRTK